MPASKKKSNINLIPQDKFAASTFGRTLNWLLSTFRVMVIFVELVVMIAFLSRFWLDAKNSDLNDEIMAKQALISASRSFEKEFNLTKEKLAILSSLSPTSFSRTLANIPPLIPGDIYLKSISLANTDININGESASEQSIAQLIANLDASNKYTSVSLTQVGFSQENGMLKFQIGFKSETK